MKLKNLFLCSLMILMFSVNFLMVSADINSGFVLKGEKSYWENSYAHINVSKHFSRNTEIFGEQRIYAPLINFSWRAPDNVVDFGFVFDFPVKGGLDVLSFEDYDYLISNCSWILSELIYNGTNGSFYRDNEFVCNPYYEVRQRYVYNDVTNLITHSLYGGRHFYFIKNVALVQGENKMLRLRIEQSSIPEGQVVKYDFVGKLSSDSVGIAISSGRYISLDPFIGGVPLEVALYRFNDTSDSGTLGYDLTNTGSVSFEQTAETIGKSANFNSTNYLSHLHNSNLSLESGNYTVFAKINVSPDFNRFMIWGKYLGTSGFFIQHYASFDIQNTNRLFVFHCSTGSGCSNKTISRSNIQNDTFETWAVTFNKATSNLSIYKDGVYDNSSLMAEARATTADLFIGFDQPNTVFSHGMIDVLYAYDELLNDSQILQLHDASNEGNLSSLNESLSFADPVEPPVLTNLLNFSITSTGVNINGSCSSCWNATLLINGVLKQMTNGSLIQNLTINDLSPLTIYLWNITASSFNGSFVNSSTSPNFVFLTLEAVDPTSCASLGDGLALCQIISFSGIGLGNLLDAIAIPLGIILIVIIVISGMAGLFIVVVKIINLSTKNR